MSLLWRDDAVKRPLYPPHGGDVKTLKDGPRAITPNRSAVGVSLRSCPWAELKPGARKPPTARWNPHQRKAVRSTIFIYVYSRIWGYERNDGDESDSKPPAVIIVPSSLRYNRELSDRPLEFEFFDGRKLYILAYNMEPLKWKNVHKADENFGKILERTFEKI